MARQAGQPKRAYTARNSRSVSGPRHENMANPSTEIKRCHSAISASRVRPQCARPYWPRASAPVAGGAPNVTAGPVQCDTRIPPRFCYQFTRCLRTIHGAFKHKTLRIRVTLTQQAMGLQAAPQGAPMHPLSGFLHDPLQAILHAARHLFVQPGRFGSLRRQGGPAGGGNGVNGRGALGAHGVGAESAGEYIACMFRQLLQGVSQRVPSRCAVCHAWPAHAVCAKLCGPICAARVPLHHLRPAACRRRMPRGACLHHRATAVGRCASRRAVRLPVVWIGGGIQIPAAPGLGPYPGDFDAQRAVGRADAGRCADLVLPLPLVGTTPANGAASTRPNWNWHARRLAPAKPVPDRSCYCAIRDTPPQSSLPRQRAPAQCARRFCQPSRCATNQSCADRRVVLVDDVMTSGASLQAASTALRAAMRA